MLCFCPANPERYDAKTAIAVACKSAAKVSSDAIKRVERYLFPAQVQDTGKKVKKQFNPRKVTSRQTRSGEVSQMAKYQFFTMPDSNRQHYTFIDMASPTFLPEKEALLAQGFEVEEDFIDARSP
ncbi:hypothetical protein JUNP479_4056 [Aeromonas jandaei]|nr:hypothetical protein JUNP479_4056 [Aeromonas jandaei]